MYPQIPLRFRGNNKGFREIIASGGTISGPPAAGGYRYHTFKSNGTFSLDVRGPLEYLVIGGGGGGGALGNAGGSGVGGGAGAVVLGQEFYEAGTYSVTVGGGGRGNSGRVPHPTTKVYISSSGNGGYSSFDGNVAGGGNGGNQGGSSGNGFTRGSNGYGGTAGGGGGANANGSSFTGGNGLYLPEWASGTGTGVSGYYAGGGGGSGGRWEARGGNGGAGGGGYGPRGSGGDEDLRQDSPTGGVASTGSGGGSGFYGENAFVRDGAYGGSGIVIVRYRIYKP